MPTRSAAPVRVNAGRSRRLALYLILTHFLAVGVIPFLPPVLGLKLVLLTLVLISLFGSLCRHAWRRCSGAIVSADWGVDANWNLRLRGGKLRASGRVPSG